MASKNPTLPADTTQDKEVLVASRERVDAADYNAISAELTARCANWLRSLISGDAVGGGFIMRGYLVVENLVPDFKVRVEPEAGENFSAAFQNGYLLKEIASAVTLVVDTEPGGVDRFDIIAIRYQEDSSDNAQRPLLTNPSVTQRTSEPPLGTGVGDGTTTLFTIDNKGVLVERFVARVNGTPVAASLATATEASGKDQVAFAVAPAAGAPILFDYYFMTGGEEQKPAGDTRFTSVTDYRVEKGTPGGGVPATPAGYIKVAEIGPLNSGVVTITNSIITQTRVFLAGADALGFGTDGDLTTWLTQPLFRLSAAKVMRIFRDANATDVEPLLRVYRRGEITRPPTFFSAEGHLRRYANYFRDDFHFFSTATSGNATWREEDVVGGVGNYLTQATGEIGGYGGVQATAVFRDRSRVRSPNQFLTTNYGGSLGSSTNIDRCWCAWTAFPSGVLDIFEYALDARIGGAESQFIRFYVDRSNSGTGLGTNYRAQVHNGTIVSGVNISFNDANPDTIVRASGSFITDGFDDTGWALVKGSATQDGIYKIGSGGVAALTLTLDAGETLSTVGADAGITIHFLPVNIDTGVLHDGVSQHVFEIMQNEAGTIQFLIDGTLVGSTAIVPDSEDYFIVWGVEKVVAGSINYVNLIEAGSGPLRHIT